MKKILGVFLICFISMSSCLGQSAGKKTLKSRFDRKNSLYGELVGSTFGLGLSYERKFYDDSTIQLNLRTGVGTIIFLNAFPLVGMNCLIGRKQHLFELGTNVLRTFAIELFGSSTVYVLANPVIGYRFQNPYGIIFRLSFTPMIPVYDPDNWISNSRIIIPLGGISMGYIF